jgi:hypothetical protein
MGFISFQNYNPYGVVQIDAGYSFTLTWLEKPGEWSYKLSSLGTLERIAVNWMKQDIRFSMNMFRLFFERISNIITKG